MIYKGIEHERLGDAPFIGALIIAHQCHANCPGCFNQHIKEEENQFSSAEHILDLVQQNPLNEGIILGGLEWTEQPDDMYELITAALLRSLKVMVYTRLTEEEFFSTFLTLRYIGPVWYKFGPYIESLRSYDHIEHGVVLATENQHIKFVPGRKIH